MALKYSIKEWGVLVFSMVFSIISVLVFSILPVGKDFQDSLLI